ncbi:hypothetical protein F4809DRAFT_611068 [Biscogniauxia mediterranea]|nr:hypothetical protein F4809DRAFT_611068 [Biscogniauxia mediterranea]
MFTFPTFCNVNLFPFLSFFFHAHFLSIFTRSHTQPSPSSYLKYLVWIFVFLFFLLERRFTQTFFSQAYCASPSAGHHLPSQFLVFTSETPQGMFQLA